MDSIVFTKRQLAKTTSLIVAEKFEKRHDVVLRKIEQLIAEEKEDGISHHNFVVAEYIDEQSKPRKMYEMNRRGFTELVLGGRKASRNFREILSNMQLSFLQTAEFVARNALREGMESDMHYKDIYKLARDRARAFAATVGQTPVPAEIEKTTHLKEIAC